MRSQARKGAAETKATVDTKAARRWLQARGVASACPLCSSADLKVSKDFFVTLGIQGGTGAPDLGSGSLLVRLRCGQCAHIMFFHARQMGLVQ